MKTIAIQIASGLTFAAVIFGLTGSTARAQGFGFNYVNPRFGLNVGAPGPIYPGGYPGYYGYRPVVASVRPLFVAPPPFVVARPRVFVGAPYGYRSYGPGFRPYGPYYRR